MILSIAGCQGFAPLPVVSLSNTNFSGLDTFLTPDKLTDLVQTKTQQILRKKDVKHPLSY
jgi:hypothetical protein